VYETGRGGFTLRGKTHVEQISKNKKSVEGKEAIVITEIPYMTNKASLVCEMGETEGLCELNPTLFVCIV
jgi:DNA gyrase subunit A